MKPLGIEQDGAVRIEPEKRKLRVADRIVAILEEKGIDRIFGIPGGTISPIYDALYDSSIQMVTCQHECMAMYMAAGYARATGRPAVVAVTSGPGVLNAITGISAAFLDEIPVLVLAGETSTQNLGRAPLQDGTAAGLDLMNLCRSITRHRETLWRCDRASSMIEHAFNVMNRRPQGPVLLQLPVDVLQGSVSESTKVSMAEPSVSVDHDRCSEIAAALSEARCPGLLLGVGARAPGVREAVIEMAEVLHCGVIADAEAKGVFPESHPLSLGIFGVGAHGGAQKFLTDQCDLLLIVGSRMDDTTTAGYSSFLRAPATLIQIDHDAARISRSYCVDLALQGELLESLRQIVGRLSPPAATRFVSRDEALQASKRAGSRFFKPVGSSPFDPRVVPGLLQRVWPDAVFTADIGNHLIFALQNLVIDVECGFNVAFGLGGMGGGIGTAIGLQLGFGLSPQVISICGDGGLLMVGNELATCVAQGVPLVIAVFNDGCLGMVQHGFENVYGRHADHCTPAVDLVAYARSLGADAIRVENIKDFERAASISGTNPLLLDIPIDPSVRAHNPRDDAYNFPVRPT